MRLSEITGIIRNNFHLAFIGVLFIGVIFLAGYFLIYKRLLGGKRVFTKKQWLVGALLMGYFIMVVGVTFLNRSSHTPGRMNLHLLSSYREAWNSFHTRHWQFVILNIIMFIPLGILLPLLHVNFQKARWTIGTAVLFTIAIEFLQMRTGLGNFVLDDILNNTIGAIIGFGITMGVVSLLKTSGKRPHRIMIYFSPLLLMVLIFTGIFTTYSLQEFGNLSIAANHSVDMKNAATSLHFEPGKEQLSVPIYQAPTYNKASAEEFVIKLFNNIQVDPQDLETIDYSNNAVYWVRGNPSYNVWVNFLDGSYSYTDFSRFDEGAAPMDADQDELMEGLARFGISIPEGAAFEQSGIGDYVWTVEKYAIGSQLINGVLTCTYFNDGTIKEVRNTIIVYDKVRDVPIKSTVEAYQELLRGNFNYYLNEKIETIEVISERLGYQLDSKGFYQPVYLFDCTINGKEYTIFIPALL